MFENYYARFCRSIRVCIAASANCLVHIRVRRSTHTYCKPAQQSTIRGHPPLPFLKITSAVKGNKKERKSIYIAPFYCTVHKALRHGSHSFTCKYTMPDFPSLHSLEVATSTRYSSRHPVAANYSFIDPEGMKGDPLPLPKVASGSVQ